MIRTIDIIAVLISVAIMPKESRVLPDSSPCQQQYVVHTIPSSIKQSIKKKYHQKISMANPGEKFQSTDVISERGLKDRRLIFWTECDDEFLMVYEHGGYAYHKHVILFVKSGDEYTVSKNMGAGKGVTIEEIKEIIKKEDVIKFDHF